MKKKNVIGTIAALLLLPLVSQAELDSKSATVRMNVAKYAKITNLDDFVLTTDNESGSAGAIYDGFDMFQLESNCAVQVDLQGEQLSSGANKITTSYKLDDNGLSFQTLPGVHKNEHKVSAEAQLGNISDQEAGDYSAEIKITVSALQ